MMTFTRVAALLLAALAGPASQARAQQAVFSSRTEAVRIDVQVNEGRKPVLGLRASDFEVADNGVPQTIDLVSFDEVPVNIVMVLDASSSLTSERLKQLRDAGARLASSLASHDQVALITFDEDVRLTSPLSADTGRVRQAIERTRVGLGTRQTALVDAVFAGMLAAESDVGRALVIVLSDGVDTGSWVSEDAVIEIAKRSDAVVYALVTHHEGRTSFLGDLTRITGGELTAIENDADVGAALLDVIASFRHRYLLSYTPSGVAKPGWHTVSVKVAGRGRTVRARDGYWADR